MAPLAGQPKLRSLKCLMCLSPVITILSLPLLLWAYGPPRTGFQAMRNPATLRPGPVPQEPGPVPQQPGPVPQQPGPVPQQPGPVHQQPGDVPQQPGPVPQQPGDVPQQPGPVPQQPGPVPQQPGDVPQQPGPVPQQPGDVPQQPGPVPQQPGDVPQEPGPVPQQPGSEFNARPHAEKVPLVAVNGTHTLLLSAYMDHRTQQVRVIAVAKRTEAVAYRCVLSCQGRPWEWNNGRATPKQSAPQQRRYHISVGDSSFHSDHYGFEYGTVDILCPLPAGCASPFHVAVTSTGKDVKRGEQHPVFLEVLNRQMRRDSFPHNFTVCFSAMFNFDNVLQLVQSMEMLRLLGVTRVVIYRTSCSPQTQRILDYYTHTGLVEVIPWSMSSVLNVSAGWNADRSPGQMHYYGQIPALNDCVYRYMYQTQYIALHDIDELILPQQVDSMLLG